MVFFPGVSSAKLLCLEISRANPSLYKCWSHSNSSKNRLPCPCTCTSAAPEPGSEGSDSQDTVPVPWKWRVEDPSLHRSFPEGAGKWRGWFALPTWQFTVMQGKSPPSYHQSGSVYSRGFLGWICLGLVPELVRPLIRANNIDFQPLLRN